MRSSTGARGSHPNPDTRVVSPPATVAVPPDEAIRTVCDRRSHGSHRANCPCSRRPRRWSHRDTSPMTRRVPSGAVTMVPTTAGSTPTYRATSSNPSYLRDRSPGVVAIVAGHGHLDAVSSANDRAVEHPPGHHELAGRTTHLHRRIAELVLVLLGDRRLHGRRVEHLPLRARCGRGGHRYIRPPGRRDLVGSSKHHDGQHQHGSGEQHHCRAERDDQP
jgi:hypothetical protein